MFIETLKQKCIKKTLSKHNKEDDESSALGRAVANSTRGLIGLGAAQISISHHYPKKRALSLSKNSARPIQ